MHHCLANILYYGTVEELSKKLEEKPKQMLIVPQFMPREAKGEFVHQENATDAHKAAPWRSPALVPRRLARTVRTPRSASTRRTPSRTDSDS